MTPIGIHGEKSYHLTTTKTPRGGMSYARIKFADCVHHYTVVENGGKEGYGFIVEIYDLRGNLIAFGDDQDFIGQVRQGQTLPATKSYAIQHAQGMVEYHLNDEEIPLWTPSGYTIECDL